MTVEQKTSKYPPSGLLRILFRIPVYFYRLGLGWMFGKRFVLINHAGRKTGKQHQTVVEVVELEKGTGNVIVVAGYGEQTQWYKNLKELPKTTIQIGNLKYIVSINLLSPYDGENIIARYLEKYVKLTGLLFSMIGYERDGTEKDARKIAREGLRFIRFVIKRYQINNSPTKRAPDVWDSAPFSSIFLALSFPAPKQNPRPPQRSVPLGYFRTRAQEG